MKKTIIPFLILLISSLIPAVGDASYIIHLKNGGRLLTPEYWEEDNYVIFDIAGGTMGIEKNSVRRIETLPTDPYRDASIRTPGQPHAPANPVQETSAKGEKRAGEEKQKVDIQEHKKKKDQMTVELDGLVEKLREATRRKDNNAKEEIKKEIRVKSGQIYQLTDEAMEQNEGRLPEGWWK